MASNNLPKICCFSNEGVHAKHFLTSPRHPRKDSSLTMAFEDCFEPMEKIGKTLNNNHQVGFYGFPRHFSFLKKPIGTKTWLRFLGNRREAAIPILNYGLLNVRGTDYNAANLEAAQTAMQLEPLKGGIFVDVFWGFEGLAGGFNKNIMKKFYFSWPPGASNE